MFIIGSITCLLISTTATVQLNTKRFDAISNFIFKLFQFNGFPFLSLTTGYSWFSWLTIFSGLSWLTGLAWPTRWCIFATSSFRSGGSRATISARITRLSCFSPISFFSRSRSSKYAETPSRKTSRSLFSYCTIITWSSIITPGSFRTWFTSRSLRARRALGSLNDISNKAYSHFKCAKYCNIKKIVTDSSIIPSVLGVLVYP